MLHELIRWKLNSYKNVRNNDSWGQQNYRMQVLFSRLAGIKNCPRDSHGEERELFEKKGGNNNE